MIQIKIIAHEALEEPLKQELLLPESEQHDAEGCSGRRFTLLRHVTGRGRSGSSLGNDVWPESNIMLILFVEDSEVPDLEQRVHRIRQAYPRLGLAVFSSPGFREWTELG